MGQSIDSLIDDLHQKKLTLLNKDKLLRIYSAILDIKYKNLQGDSAELGVYRGGSSFFISLLLNRTHYAIDTFYGIPEVSSVDSLKVGSFSNVNYQGVVELLRGTKSVLKREKFTEKTLKDSAKFSLVHFDGDVYQSCLDFLNYFYPRVVKGGYMFFDDFGHLNTKGVEMALAEFLVKHSDHSAAFISSKKQYCIIK